MVGQIKSRKMKINFFKYLLAFFVLSITLQGCVKESFPGDDLGDNGTTFLKTPAGDFVVHWLSPFKTKQKISLFDLFKDAHNSTELNSKQTVKMLFNQSIIDAYNEEHETELIPLPSDFYTWANGQGVEVAGNNISVNFGDGLIYGDFSIELDGSKWTDLASKYALAFEITDYGNLTPSSDLTDTIVVQLGLKNAYDGVYRYQTSGATSLVPNADKTVTLETTGEHTVRLYPGLLATYSNEVSYTIDPVTFHVTVTCPSLGVQTPQDARSNWDPEKKILTVFWKQGNGGRTFEETFTFLRAR